MDCTFICIYYEKLFKSLNDSFTSVKILNWSFFDQYDKSDVEDTNF